MVYDPAVTSKAEEMEFPGPEVVTMMAFPLKKMGDIAVMMCQ